MKELTIEQKAKRYDEAINIAKSKIKNDKDHVLYEEDIIDIFPELKKKTDEEIRQQLIAVCHLYYGEEPDAERDECLEWLEKQAKQKPIERKGFTSIPFGAFDSELYESMITIPDGCVATIEGNKIHIKRKGKSATEASKEEKVNDSNYKCVVNKDSRNGLEITNLKVGDYVVRKDGKNFHNNKKFAQIIKTDTTMYQVDYGSWLYNDEIRLWSILDAQDGDILASSSNKPFIYNNWFNKSQVGAYCGLNVHNEFTISNPNKTWYWTNNYNIRPATKEECQSLFGEMKLLGWTWNPETKELNRLDKNNENNN